MNFEQPPVNPTEPQSSEFINQKDSPTTVSVETSFENPSTGRVSEIVLENESKIGSGEFGDVYSAEAKLGSHSLPVAIKKLRPNPLSPDADRAQERVVEQVNHSAKMYTLLKSAGLPVWPTFRVDQARQSMLMTLGTNDTWICVGPNNQSEESRPESLPLLNTVSNLEDVLAALFEHANLAAEQRILLYHDTVLFMINRNDPEEIRYIFGDYDNVETTDNLSEMYVYQGNSANMAKALWNFVRKNVKPGFAQWNLIRNIRKLATEHQIEIQKSHGNGKVNRKGAKRIARSMTTEYDQELS